MKNLSELLLFAYPDIQAKKIISLTIKFPPSANSYSLHKRMVKSKHKIKCSKLNYNTLWKSHGISCIAITQLILMQPKFSKKYNVPSPNPNRASFIHSPLSWLSKKLCKLLFFYLNGCHIHMYKKISAQIMNKTELLKSLFMNWS